MEPYPPAFEDVPANQIFMGKEVRKYGVVKKKSGGRKIPLIQNKYESRFVIISKGWVYYYKDKSSDKPQGKFSLQGFSNRVIIAEEEQSSMPYVFKIYSKKANERTWFFATENPNEMHDWMEAFRSEIDQYNLKGITNIRPSKSCPVNPNQNLSTHSDINNGRSQSVNANSVPFPERLTLSPSYTSSCTNVTNTSGIGSSTSSINDQPDDEYEPVDASDEWSNTSSDSEYETPVSQFDPHSHHNQQSNVQHSTYNPSTSRHVLDLNILRHCHTSHLRNPSTDYKKQIRSSSMGGESITSPHLEPAPTIPSKDLMPRPHSIAVPSDHHLLADELRHIFPGRRPIPIKPRDRPLSYAPACSPPKHSPPSLRRNQRPDLNTFSGTRFDKIHEEMHFPPNLPAGQKNTVRNVENSIPRHSALSSAHHSRHKSEEAIRYEKQHRSSTETKRHSAPCESIQELRNQIAAKFVFDSPQQQMPGGYRQTQSPLGIKPLPPLPEPDEENYMNSDVHEQPDDLPNRAPPLPPGRDFGSSSHQEDVSPKPPYNPPKHPVTTQNPSSPHRYPSPSRFSPLPPRPGQNKFSTPPALPGKPKPLPPTPLYTPSYLSSTESQFLQYDPERYDDTGTLPSYDNNVIPDACGTYYVALEDDPDQSYESPYSDDAVTDVVYEDENSGAHVNQSLVQDRPAPHMKSAQQRFGHDKAHKGGLNKLASLSPTQNESIKPTHSCQSRLRSPTSATISSTPKTLPKPVTDNNSSGPSWLNHKLKSMSQGDLIANTTKQIVAEPKVKSEISKMQGHKPKPNNYVKSSNQTVSGLPSNNESLGKKPIPPLSGKPKPPPMQKPKNITPALSHNQVAGTKPSPPPTKPKPKTDTKPISSVALMRERFNQ